MRQIIGAAALLAVIAAAGPAVAGDYPYCLQGRDWGYPGKCDFTSYRQCQASASGTFSYCGTNPRFAYGQMTRGPRARHQGW